MRKLIAVAAVGLFSSVAFAQAPAESNPLPEPTKTVVPGEGVRINLACRFEGRKQEQQGHREVECRVRASVCLEEEADASATRVHSCRSDRNEEEEAIAIECTDGFRLRAREVAEDLEDNTLWLNAQQGERIATLRIRHLLETNSSRRRADLMYSPDEGRANRLEGACEVEIRHDVPLN